MLFRLCLLLTILASTTPLLAFHGDCRDDPEVWSEAQGGSAACQFAITPANQSFLATGGSGAVTLTSSELQCAWAARSNSGGRCSSPRPARSISKFRPGASPGTAVISVASGSGAGAMDVIQITPVSPALFSADASGTGYAAATILRIKGDGSQSYEPVVAFNAAQNRFVALPIDLGPPGDQVFLILFGTGVRNRSALSTVTARIGGESAERQSGFRENRVRGAQCSTACGCPTQQHHGCGGHRAQVARRHQRGLRLRHWVAHRHPRRA